MQTGAPLGPECSKVLQTGAPLGPECYKVLQEGHVEGRSPGSPLPPGRMARGPGPCEPQAAPKRFPRGSRVGPLGSQFAIPCCRPRVSAALRRRARARPKIIQFIDLVLAVMALGAPSPGHPGPNVGRYCKVGPRWPQNGYKVLRIGAPPGPECCKVLRIGAPLGPECYEVFWAQNAIRYCKLGPAGHRGAPGHQTNSIL